MPLPLCVRIDFRDRQSAQALAADGWREIETLVRWTRQIPTTLFGGFDYEATYKNCRMGTAADLDACLAIAAGQFGHDRLHADDVPEADVAKEQWIRDAWEFADPKMPYTKQEKSCFVCDEGGIQGFIISRSEPLKQIVDLICVGESARRRGVGRRLVEKAAWSTPNRGYAPPVMMEAGASSRNLAAQEFWARCGFVPDVRKRTFHKP